MFLCSLSQALTAGREKQLTPHKQTIGWREWLTLPELGLPLLKAKIDSGARTSALHACFIEEFERAGVLFIRFGVHPLQRNTTYLRVCEAAVKEIRTISDSGGHREERYVIETHLQLAGHCWPVELTLTNRETMLFRMLLGRTAMCQRFVVDPSTSYLLGKHTRRELREIYSHEAHR